MLKRLWGWLVGAPKRDLHAPSRTRAEAQTGHGGKPADKAGKESYLERLEREHAQLGSLSAEQGEQTRALIAQVTAYVRDHQIDPPVMPALATRMLELLRQPEIDVAALSRLIERDQASAAKLMNVANSAAFRGAHEIGNVRDAVVFLGTRQVAQIALGLATRALFESPAQAGRRPTDARFLRLFEHAMTTAFAACQLATRRNQRHADAAFLGGLFHDVGKAVALRAVTQMAARARTELTEDAVLDAALHMLHRDPKAVMYESWQLPKQLMTMCQHHHELGPDTPADLHVVRLVSALDALAAGCDFEKRDALREIAESTSALAYTDAELRVAHTETREFAGRVATMFR